MISKLEDMDKKIFLFALFEYAKIYLCYYFGHLRETALCSLDSNFRLPCLKAYCVRGKNGYHHRITVMRNLDHIKEVVELYFGDKLKSREIRYRFEPGCSFFDDQLV